MMKFQGVAMKKLITLIILISLLNCGFSYSQSFGGTKSKTTKSSKTIKVPRAKKEVASTTPAAAPVIITQKAASPKAVKAPKEKKGMMSKIKDAAARGFGWGLGKEAAKATVNGIKGAVKSVTSSKDDKQEPKK